MGDNSFFLLIGVYSSLHIHAYNVLASGLDDGGGYLLNYDSFEPAGVKSSMVATNVVARSQNSKNTRFYSQEILLADDGGFIGGGGSSGGGGASLNDGWSTAKKQVEKRFKDIEHDFYNVLAPRVDNIKKSVSNVQLQIQNLVARVTNLENNMDTIFSAYNKLSKAYNATVSHMDSNFSIMDKNFLSVQNSLKSMKTDVNNAVLKSEQAMGQVVVLDRVVRNYNNLINENKSIAVEAKNTANSLSKSVSGITTRLNSVETESFDNYLSVSRLNVEFAELKDEVKEKVSQSYVDKMIDFVDNKASIALDTADKNENKIKTLATTATVKNLDNQINKRIDDLELLIQGGGSGGGSVVEGWQDALLEALKFNTLISRVDDLKKLWYSEDYAGGILPEDGDAVRAFKQFLITQAKTRNNQLTNLFTMWFRPPMQGTLGGGMFWQGYQKYLAEGVMSIKDELKKYFDMDNKESSLYRLRYSIVEGFTESQDMLLKLLQGSNLTNEWLRYIFEKEIVIPPNISTPFDFTRLQEILNGLDFGTGGESGWLKELIKTVGSVIETAISTLGDVLKSGIDNLYTLLGKVLDFLDSLLDKVLHLVVPENLNFLYESFNGLSDKFSLKFNFVIDGIDSIKNLFGTNQEVFDDWTLNIGFIDGVSSVKLPTSKINDFAIYLKPLMTAFLVFDFIISMYKWFHERGQLLE